MLLNHFLISVAAQEPLISLSDIICFKRCARKTRKCWRNRGHRNTRQRWFTRTAKGDTGDRGSKGESGVTGSKGEKGVPGSIGVPEETGEPGSRDEAGNCCY